MRQGKVEHRFRIVDGARLSNLIDHLRTWDFTLNEVGALGVLTSKEIYSKI